MSYADRKIEAVNRISREVTSSLEYWDMVQNSNPSEYDLTKLLIESDEEVRTEINTLIETIVEEIKSATQKDDA